TEFDLMKAKDRAHILEGLKKAQDNIDSVIKIIKQSKDKETAKANLINKFKLSEKQAIAILEIKLQQLANLERQKIEDELKEKRALIKELEAILSSPKRIADIIKKELQAIKERFGSERRTQIVKGAVGEFSQEDLIPNEATVLVITRDGYIKRLSPELFKAQSRGGKGVMGLTTKEEDMVEQIFSTTTHCDLLFFTTKGRVFQLKAYEVPATSRTAKGQAIVNFLQLSSDEKVSAILPLAELADFKYLVMATKQGVIKKVDIGAFEKVRRSGLIAIKLKGDDRLEWIKPSTGKDHVMLVTANGQAIRFKETDVREMGRNASGVRGIRLKKSDLVEGMDVVDGGKAMPSLQLLVVMENGYGKRTDLKHYKIQGRGGSGIKTANITSKTGIITSAFIVNAKLEKEDLIIISSNGQVIRLPLKSVNILGRATQGIRLMRFKEVGDKVASVAFI
ncbi:MAG: DNA gyrase C-terminal beta-propeller domain-containing protein, partial [bacterium]